eukprot:TRINITY_DN106211_c0_g1_i1.p1 TRINITY_DN106211_c0_g1~~TRINITY_DN106211_c0_g1_i1.p1  ORF type:complete len:395 (+),score=75.76 TRINITY_DN106211_c0_g1_i1:37-1185(+)
MAASKGRKQHRLLSLVIAVLVAVLLAAAGSAFAVTIAPEGARKRKPRESYSRRTPDWRSALGSKLVGKEVKGTVKQVNPLSAVVEIPGFGMRGIFHVSDACTERVEKAEDIFAVDQEVVARVWGFQDGQLQLARVDNPMFDLQVGSEVRGTVVKVNPLSADVDIADIEAVGNFHVREFRAEYTGKGEDVFSLGQEVVARVKGFRGPRVELTRVDSPELATPIGSEVRGTVTKVNELSADIDIPGSALPGNFHIAEYSKDHVDKAEDVFSVGQEVVARVKRFQGKNQLYLTRVDHPEFAMPVGSEVRGTVTAVNPLSADVEIAESELPGNFHVSDFSADHIDKASDVFSVGQEVVARVKGFNGRRSFKLTRLDHPLMLALADQ